MNGCMQFFPVKTRPLVPPQDDLYAALDESLPAVQEGDVVIITSKVVAIHQGRCIKMSEVADKDALIKQEADAYIDRVECPGGYVVLTIKDHTLAASAGIDESNANGYYVLWPDDPTRFAKEAREYLRKKYGLEKLGVLIVDSRSMPLRFGAVGVAVGGYGFNPLRDYRGTKDIFGRELKMSRTNIADSLAAASAVVMGEGNETTPVVIARNVPQLEFTGADRFGDLFMPIEEDIYYPLLKHFYEHG